jgi:hypothetical protein
MITHYAVVDQPLIIVAFAGSSDFREWLGLDPPKSGTHFSEPVSCILDANPIVI